MHSREYYRTKVIPNMAAKARKRISENIGTSFYAITCDGWSQPTKSPSLFRSLNSLKNIKAIFSFSLTIHSVNEQFERNDFVLCAIPMDENKHSGENIAYLL